MRSECDCSCEALAERQAECREVDRTDVLAAIECARCFAGECLQAMIDCGL